MGLPWIGRAADAPYFVTQDGQDWTPIGQNDAVGWTELNGLWRGRDLPAVRQHLAALRASGVTVLRLMLEYAQDQRRYLENPIGRFNPPMVQLWDDLFALCEEIGLRILLTPYDTFFQWNRFAKVPMNQANGGPAVDRSQLLTCPETRKAIKARFHFATTRWGASGALFAWDLWNEMHPAQGGNLPTCFQDYIDDIGPWLRDLETGLHGRAHLQCVSVFGPELGWKPWLNEPIFRHPALDFASSHFYEEGTIDHPADTVAPALAVARLVREALAEIADDRPFLDSEHGPIHTFKDRKRNLPEAFDDEYFRHIQWAHLASGGAGGGMRWPNRKPHTLTPGMRRAQAALAGFLPLIAWSRFRRRNLHGQVACSDPDVEVLACGDGEQAVCWLLRTRPLLPDGRVDLGYVAAGVEIKVPLRDGEYRATFWDTREGKLVDTKVCTAAGGIMTLLVPPFLGDLAVAVTS